jgi:hypothetical protein
LSYIAIHCLTLSYDKCLTIFIAIYIVRHWIVLHCIGILFEFIVRQFSESW